MTFFAFMLNRPIVLMCRFSPSSPSASICSGVSHLGEQVPGGEVHAGIGRLRGEHDRDQQGIVVDRLELGLRIGNPVGEPPVEFGDVGLLHRIASSAAPSRSSPPSTIAVGAPIPIRK